MQRNKPLPAVKKALLVAAGQQGRKKHTAAVLVNAITLVSHPSYGTYLNTWYMSTVRAGAETMLDSSDAPHKPGSTRYVLL